MSFLIFNKLQDAEEACQQIDNLMGFPDGQGTEHWAVPIKAYSKNLWYIPKPIEIVTDGISFFEERESIEDLRQPNVLCHEARKK